MILRDTFLNSPCPFEVYLVVDSRRNPRFWAGLYYQIGLKTSLLRISENWLCKISFSELKLQLKRDGPSLCKNLNWPMSEEPSPNEVFIVAIYAIVLVPSDFNDMSTVLVTDLQLASIRSLLKSLLYLKK